MPTKFTASGVRLLTTATGICYQAPSFTNPSGSAVVISSIAANTNTASVSFSSHIFNPDGSTLSSTVLNATPIAANNSLEYVENKLVLLSGQSLRCVSSVASGIHVTTSVLEVYP